MSAKLSGVGSCGHRGLPPRSSGSTTMLCPVWASTAVPAREKDVEMIDFTNGSVFRLSPEAPEAIAPAVAPLIIEGEQILACFKAVRDFVVFTNKRMIAVNVQGMTGKKRDYTSLPYSKVQAFSIETAGTFDLDAELELWFSGLGKVRLEFKGNYDVRWLGHLIATYVL